MASKRQDSTTSSEEDGEERALFTRNVEIVEKAKRGLFEEQAAEEQPVEEQAAEEQPVEEQAARRTRAAKPPVRGYVSSSTSSYLDDSDQDKTVDPGQLSEDSSDRKSRRLEERELKKKQLELKKKQLEKKKKQPELKKKEPGFPSGK